MESNTPANAANAANETDTMKVVQWPDRGEQRTIEDQHLATMSSLDSLTRTTIHSYVSIPEVVGADYAEIVRKPSIDSLYQLDHPYHPYGTDHSRDWMRNDKQNKWKIYAEAALASLIVIGLVVGAVVGTESLRHKSDSNGPSSTPTPIIAKPNADDIPIGKVFNATFTLAGVNCTNPCRLAPEGYSAGVSQNLYGDSTNEIPAWSCGTCWSLVPQWDGDKMQIANSSTIVVRVKTICPATASNELCCQKDLGPNSTNVHGAVVNFNLCPESGAPEAMFGNSGIGLGVGTAVRVDCPL